MIKSPEIPNHENTESTKEDKHMHHPESFTPSSGEVNKRAKAMKEVARIREEEKVLDKKGQERVERDLGDTLLREDFTAQAESFSKVFKNIEVKVGGETYIMAFTGLNKDGKRVETDKLVKEVGGKSGLSLDRIDGEFELRAVKKGIKGVEMSCSIPVKRILTCQTPAMLKQYITENFAGTTDYYSDLRENAESKNKEAREDVLVHHEQSENLSKKNQEDRKEAMESRIAQIKKAVSEAGGESSILSGDNFTSISAHIGSNQLRLTSTTGAVWSVETVENGKLKGRSVTRKPLEFIKPSEAE
jgi:hypothetical protein